MDFNLHKKAFIVACITFSRLPMPWQDKITAEDTGRSLLWLPALGGVIGLTLVISALAIAPLWPSPICAALLLTLWVCLTGGIHLDGLADSSDAWLGGFGQRERALEIMKDPRCGAAAVIFVALLLLVKFVALNQLLSQSSLGLAGLILAPLLGRSAGLLLCTHTPCARSAGLSADFSRHTPHLCGLFIGLISFACAALFIVLYASAFHALMMIALSGLCFYLLRRMMLKHLGGYTGDTCGALIEVVEASTLLALATIY